MAFLRLPGTLDLLDVHTANPGRYPYLLETFGAQGWDILFAFPQQELVYAYDELLAGDSVFKTLESQWRSERQSADKQKDETFPFNGGWFVYLGYELLHELEPSVPRRQAENGFPLAAITRIPAAIMCNKSTQETFLFAESSQSQLLAQLKNDVQRIQGQADGEFLIQDLQEEEASIYLNSTKKVQRYIREGDVFQVNLSRQWQARIVGNQPALSLYASLRKFNPAAFGGLARYNQHAIVSSSPERLIKVSGDLLETRPIAGTYPRSTSPSKDQALRRELIDNPKERAEHIMLVDLERNDLGRIAKPGTVNVKELMRVATYTHVHHIESIIHAIKRDNVTPVDILRAVFPGGTITGCPKVRTMQIINELEASPRFAYTGSMGYVNHSGDMDFNILIRSFMLSADRLTFRAGGGIVADSDPQRELEETRAKAEGLIRSLGIVHS